MRALVSVMDQKMAEMQGQVQRTRAQNGTLAARFETLANDYHTIAATPHTEHSGDAPDDRIVGDDPKRPTVQMTDFTSGDQPPPSPRAGTPVDPTNRWVGDERFGRWATLPPPAPYVGSPPPLTTEIHKFPDDTPLKVGPTTGLYTPNKTWIADGDAPLLQGKEGYRFKLSGEEATTTTRMVNENGQWVQQRWVANTYEYQRNSGVAFGGDFAGASPPTHIDQQWKPISLPQIANLSHANPQTTYYLPDGCGGSLTFKDAVPTGGIAPPPSPPVMTAPR